MRTRAELEAEMARIDTLLARDVMPIWEQGYLDAAKAALGWALGDYTDAPVDAMED